MVSQSVGIGFHHFDDVLISMGEYCRQNKHALEMKHDLHKAAQPRREIL
tara:strand:+ start:4384 stop:4530 length:147 start_codon:yes stop_codon:yes gene_type:complete